MSFSLVIIMHAINELHGMNWMYVQGAPPRLAFPIVVVSLNKFNSIQFDGFKFFLQNLNLIFKSKLLTNFSKKNGVGR